MLVIGLTGGIGSGKSLASQYFGSLGAQVIDADDLARKSIERGSDGFNEVVSTFGDNVLRNGDIDRKELANEIFLDPAKRKILEAIIHPRVKKIFESALAAIQEGEIVIYEIPLLAESGEKERFDFVITVEAPIDERVTRLKKKGLFLSDIEARISSQATSEERRAIADLVIENDLSPEELLRKVEYIWNDVIPEIKHRKSQSRLE